MKRIASLSTLLLTYCVDFAQTPTMNEELTLPYTITKVDTIQSFDSLKRKMKEQWKADKWLNKMSRRKTFVYPSTHQIIYDFKTGEYTPQLKKIRVHTPIVFRIKNINPLAYNISIVPTDSIVSPSSFDFTESQNEIKAREAVEQKLEEEQTMEDQQVNSLPTINNKDIVHTDSVNIVTKSFKAMSKNDDLLTKKAELTEKLKNANLLIDTVNSEQTLLLTPSDSSSLYSKSKLLQPMLPERKVKVSTVEIIRKIDSLDQEIKTNDSEIALALKTFNSLQRDFMMAYQNYLIDCRRVFRIVKNAKIISTIAEDPNLSYETYKNYEKELSNSLNELRIDKQAVEQYKKTYSELTNMFMKLKYDPSLGEYFSESGIKKLYAYPTYIKEKSDRLYNRLLQLPVDTYIKKSEWIANILSTKDPFTYTSIPVQPINDLIEFKVYISQRNKSMSDDLYTPRSFVYRQPTYAGSRVDFSLGLAMSHFNTTTYDLGYKEDETSLSIFEKADRLNAPSLVGLITMSDRSAKYTSIGGSAGLGIDVINGKIQLGNFFVGPTLLFGKQDRLFLSFGATVRNVQKLESDYKEGDKVPLIKDISGVLTDYYKLGVFASVTYSLTKNARDMISKIKR